MSNTYLPTQYSDSELIIGLVGAVGTDLRTVSDIVKDKLKTFDYLVETISVSSEIISNYFSEEEKQQQESEYSRIYQNMEKGNELRKNNKDASFLAKAVANMINIYRNKVNGGAPLSRTAFIIRSLKTEDEVRMLRDIYGNGFYLFGIYTDVKIRTRNLTDKGINLLEANSLIVKDENENNQFGQHTRDTFQLSDFFIDYLSGASREKAQIHRMIDLIFGHPYLTPTFGEYAMFKAYCSSLRSADLSRQVGAVICRDNEVLASGVNDCPNFGGGLYWSKLKEVNPNEFEYVDCEDGRDYKRGFDTNKKEFLKIAEELLSKFQIDKSDENIQLIKQTQLGDITEYGRIVHAEMEAITMCARNNISCAGAKLYVTTFPCHNCAKHIISSGIKEVIYIEPYPKSKAFEMYSDSITQDEVKKNGKVLFLPYFGVGPKKFTEIFSVTNGTSYDRIRKDKCGNTIDWQANTKRIRDQMLPSSYIDREKIITAHYLEITKENNNEAES